MSILSNLVVIGSIFSVLMVLNWSLFYSYAKAVRPSNGVFISFCGQHILYATISLSSIFMPMGVDCVLAIGISVLTLSLVGMNYCLTLYMMGISVRYKNSDLAVMSSNAVIAAALRFAAIVLQKSLEMQRSTLLLDYTKAASMIYTVVAVIVLIHAINTRKQMKKGMI